MNSVKRHVCDVKNLRLRFDLPVSVNDNVISLFCEDFIFTKVSRIKHPSENFRIYSI